MKNNDWKILRNGTRVDYSIIIGVVLLLLMMIVLNVKLVFDMISNQTEEIGQMQLENIRSELQSTLTDAENTTMRVALEVEQMMAANASREELSAYFERQSKEQFIVFKEACLNVYIGGKDWAIIPDFDIPDDFHPPERLWYKGALENPGKAYITEPYFDLRTSAMCFTISTVLSDKETVVALDFNFANTQRSIKQMAANGNRTALIVTKSGKIISYNDMSLVGENVSKKLPEYESILNEVVSQIYHESFVTDLNGKTNTIFSSQTNNGWYMILSVDNWALHKDNYQQVVLNALVSFTMIVSIVIFYLVGIKNRIKAEQALRVKEQFLSHLSKDLKDPLQRILTLSNVGSLGSDTDPAENAKQVKESATKLSAMLDDLFTFSTLVETEKENPVNKESQNLELSQTSHRVRFEIIAVLIFAMVFSLSICINNIISWGDTKINREVDIYDYQLSNWIEKHKSILSMFTNMIAERPRIMENYEGAVTWLNDIAKNYPEISVCYMTNPYKEHTVIMNNGWQPPEGWKVEER